MTNLKKNYEWLLLYLKTIIKIGYKIKNLKVLNVLVSKKVKKKN